ncbi:hypothetical protein LSH36_23g08044 [Paralvinella palmiformis]|uniref:Uncharacterized protein n=1 Tax=Paralvinella palmiformis TaxID=53620 RepID=A0AAD9KB68_9ANNE|nr:hypothetical protein LSH36_23g08044 [Paralvinella palmiformis]
MGNGLLKCHDYKILKHAGIRNPYRNYSPAVKRQVVDTVGLGHSSGYREFQNQPYWIRKKIDDEIPKTAVRNLQSVECERAVITSHAIKSWFEGLKEFLTERGNQYILGDPPRIYNCDERGFPLVPARDFILALNRISCLPDNIWK